MNVISQEIKYLNKFLPHFKTELTFILKDLHYTSSAGLLCNATCRPLLYWCLSKFSQQRIDAPDFQPAAVLNALTDIERFIFGLIHERGQTPVGTPQTTRTCTFAVAAHGTSRMLPMPCIRLPAACILSWTEPWCKATIDYRSLIRLFALHRPSAFNAWLILRYRQDLFPVLIHITLHVYTSCV